MIPAPSIWKGPGGGSFHEASNWTNGIVPNAVDATACFADGIAERLSEMKATFYVIIAGV